MIHVVTGPPQRSLLHRRRTDERPHEPRAAVHLEGAMREVPVKGQRQADRAEKVGHGPQPEQRPRKGYAEGQQGGRLDHPEHYYRKNIEQNF
jgi:hypothetical protein